MYTKQDIVTLTGVKWNTIRKWRSLGMLPGPIPGTGRKDARYDDAFLRAVERVKSEYVDARLTRKEFAERLSYERQQV